MSASIADLTLGLSLLNLGMTLDRLAKEKSLPSQRASLRKAKEAVGAAAALLDHAQENRLAIEERMALPFPDCECAVCALAREATTARARTRAATLAQTEDDCGSLAAGAHLARGES